MPSQCFQLRGDLQQERLLSTKFPAYFGMILAMTTKPLRQEQDFERWWSRQLVHHMSTKKASHQMDTCQMASKVSENHCKEVGEALA